MCQAICYAYQQNLQSEIVDVEAYKCFFVFPYQINIMSSKIQLTYWADSASCLYVRMITQIALAASFKCLIICALYCNICTLCDNTWKSFGACSVSLHLHIWCSLITGVIRRHLQWIGIEGHHVLICILLFQCNHIFLSTFVLILAWYLRFI